MSERPREPLIVTGASGLIGTRLCVALERAGRPVVRVSRAPRGPGWASWEELPRLAADGAAVVNLAGAPVAGRRWTAAVRAEILSSRVRAAEAVAAAAPRVWLQASAVGWYGDRGDEVLDESAAPGRDFLAEISRAWEAPALAYAGTNADAACASGIAAPPPRAVVLRFGVVLAPEGGALQKMLPIFRAGLGGRLGSGRAWMPWIHADDAISMILATLDDPRWRGPVNVVAPEPVRNVDFTRALAATLRRPAFLPAPAFALRAAFGGGAQVLLASQRAVPAVARARGYRFRWPDLGLALADLLAARG